LDDIHHGANNIRIREDLPFWGNSVHSIMITSTIIWENEKIPEIRDAKNW